MDVDVAIQSRRSIRKYEKRELPMVLLDDMLDHMRLAPSANNMQRWQVVVVTDEETKQKLVPACGNQKFVGSCSAFLVGVTESKEPLSAVDLSIALDHLSLRAVECGLGTCWIGDFDPDELKKELGIPEGREISICMTLGYPSHTPSARKRKSIPELFHHNRWGEPLS